MQIGSRTTLDKLGRITLLKELRDLFMMEDGDTLTYHSENGRVYIQKETELYEGKYDFESEMIADRVRKYEDTMKMLDGSEFEDDPVVSEDAAYLDPEEAAERQEAYQQFLEDIKNREKNKKSKKNKN